jgi:predicted regulator of Ras-like GTPase activity (Roadblock/LC7/MglB family)
MSEPIPFDSRATRNEEIDAILHGLTLISGVTAAAVVDSDGLVTHIRRDFDVDTDALGASVQIVFGAASRACEHVRHNKVNIVISENAGGLIMLAPLKSGLVLSLFADKDAMLGAIRFELKETIPALNRLL